MVACRCGRIRGGARSPQVRDMASSDGGRLLLAFNPQWQTDGQIVSDFGCGPGLLFSHALPSLQPAVSYMRIKTHLWMRRLPAHADTARVCQVLEGVLVGACRFGRSKREAEDFVGSFVDVSVTQRLRIMGDDVRLFRCYPGHWQVLPLGIPLVLRFSA